MTESPKRIDSEAARRVQYPVTTALLTYYAGTLVVLLGAVFGFEQIPADHRSREEDLVVGFSRWDGEWYARIAKQGYDYREGATSNVAFFPVYPLLAAAVSWCTGVRVEVALLIVTQLCLIGAFLVFHAYLLIRHRPAMAETQKTDVSERSYVTGHTLIAISFWPTTFFFRMAYSESLFLFLCLLAFYGMQRDWSPWILAAVTGLATAARPVGIALVLPLAWHLWQGVGNGRCELRRLFFAAFICLVGAWGLLAYMLYQQSAFGNALAFAKTQDHWTMRKGTTEDKLIALATLEPVWSVYVPESDSYWGKKVNSIHPLFNLQAANPIYVVITVALIVYGARRDWLNTRELLLSAGLILIPYLTRGYEMCMASQGRFVAVAFPMYIVMGELLSRVPPPWQTLFIAPGAFLMGIYSALFAAGFLLI